MKKILSKNSKWILLGSYICIYVLPYILKSILMKISGQSLSECMVILCETFSGVAALAFLMCFFYFYFYGQFSNAWNKDKRKELFYKFIKCILYQEIKKWVVWFVVMGGIFTSIFWRWIGILFFVVGIIFLFYLLLKTFWEFIICLHIEECVSKDILKAKGIYKGFFSKSKRFSVKSLLLTIGVVIVGKYGGILGTSIFHFFFEVVEPAFVSRVFSKFLIALFMTFIFYQYLQKMKEVFAISLEEAELLEEQKTEKKAVTNRKVAVVSVWVMAIWGLNLLLSGLYGKENILDKVENVMAEAEKNISNENTLEGIELYLKAEEYVGALEQYLDGKYQEIYKTMENHPRDEFYKQLYYAKKENVKNLEQSANNLQISINGMFRLLDIYAQMEELTEEQIQVKEKFVDACISREWFYTKNRWIDEEELKQKEVKNIVDKYKEQLSYADIMVWIQQAIRDSGVSYKKSKEILSITEKNEDDILYQLVALIFGSQNVSKTDISYVRKLKNAVEQFDKLYEQQMAEVGDTQSILKEKLYVSRVLIQCRDYESAFTVLNSADKYGEMEELIEYKLFCLKVLGRFEELEQYAISYGSENMNEIAAYYSAIAYLKQGKISESLKQGVILEEMVLEAEAEDREYKLKLLYSYVQFLCIYNKSTVEYDCRVREYSEEQLRILQSAPLLKNYIDTVNAIYNEKDYEKARNYLYEIEKICPGLSMSMYLEGVTALESSDYETAHRAFMDCIKINDSNYAAIYSLAVIYDACEEYEKSYQMCKQAKEKMMTIDHGIDWYGIGAHIDHLMSLLESEKGA